MLFKEYKDKKILVTGNTGFKGSWLTCWLLELGAKVYGISREIPTKPSLFSELGLEDKIDHTYIDIIDYESLHAKVLEIKPDYIFHLAAQPIVSISYADPMDTIKSNVIGTMNILESMRQSDFKSNLVIITSDKAYKNVEQLWGYKETDMLGGHDIYSGSKGAAELVIQSYFSSFFQESSNLKIAVGRAGNVIGGGDWAKDRLIVDTVLAWKENKRVKVRNPNATRPWQHVLEPLSGYLQLGIFCETNPKIVHGEAFNFGPQSDQLLRVEEVIRELSKSWTFKSPTEIPYQFVDNNLKEASLLKLNCDKALSALGWKSCLHLNETIELTGNWYYSFYNDSSNIYDLTISQIHDYEEIASEKGIEWTKKI